VDTPFGVYTWYNSSGPISGAYSQSYTTPILSLTESYYVVVDLNNGCNAETYFFTADVVPSSSSDPVGSNTNACAGDNAVLKITPVSGYTYEWYELGSSVKLRGDDALGDMLSTGESYTINYPLGTELTINGLFANRSFTVLSRPPTNSTCAGTGSTTVAAFVLPLPSVSGGASLTTCHDSPSFVLGGAPSGGSWSGSGVLNNSFNPSSVSVGNHLLTYNYTDGVTGCSAKATKTVSVFAKPMLNSNLMPSPICSGTEFSYNPTSSIVGSTFNWSRAAISGISEPSSSGSARISENLTNNLDAPVNVTYTVSATSNACLSASVSVVVAVNPSPALNSSRNVGPIASSSSFDYAPTSATIGTTFTWSRALISGITQQANGGTGNVNEVLTNTTANPLNVTYLFSGTANGCTGPTSSVIVTVNPIPNNYNYIITRDMQSDKKADGSVITVADVASLPVHLKAENITYFDGLGRPIQSVATQASPNRLDIVTPVVYDAFGRERFKFLPIVTGSDGYYKPNETMVDPVNVGYINAAASFYGQANSTIASDPRPFSETVFEPSPLNRPAKQFGPGVAWKDHRDPNNPIEKPVIRNYLINALNEVYGTRLIFLNRLKVEFF
jgi:hypothetical protein